MLYISDGQLEHCSAQKSEITVACPSIWIHYVISGKGYYNGAPLGRGEAFIVYKNDVCRYAPDREEPWTYVWVRLEGRDDEGLLAKCGLPSVSGVFSFDYAEELARMADVLFSEAYALNTNQAYKEASAKLVLSLHTGSEDEHEQKWDERWVTRAKDYIAASYHKGIRVEEIARELHVDRKYLRNGVIVPSKVSDDSFSFEHGIVVFKHRFSIKRSLNDYEETTLYRCISMSIRHVYKTMACDKLTTEMNILYKDDNNKVQCTELDLHDWTFKVIHKGDMSINI